MFGLDFKIYVGLAIAAALGLGGLFLYHKGVEDERDRNLLAMLTSTVQIHKQQQNDTVKVVLSYGQSKQKTATSLASLVPSVVNACMHGRLLPTGIQVLSADGERVPVASTGIEGGDASATNAASRWCEALGQTVKAGAENTDALNLCLGWIDANGGKKE